MITINRYSATCLIAMATALLSIFPIFRASAAQVADMRVNSEPGKTRVVIQFDKPVQYQAQYTSAPGISICLPKTGLGTADKMVDVSDEMVQSVTLREIMGNTVDVSISLRKHVSFTVFPLESPDRIVIDIMSDKTTTCYETGAGITENADVFAMTDTPDTEMDNEKLAEPVINMETKPASQLNSLLPFSISKYAVGRFCFDALLVISLVVMGINLWRVLRISKNNPDALKKYQTFADMVNEGAKSHKIEKSSLKQQHIVTIKNRDSEVRQRRKDKRGSGIKTASPQKQYRKVHELAQLGMDRLAISQQSNVPIGEVNLILDLSRGDLKGKPN